MFVVPNLYEFISSVNTKEDILKNAVNHTVAGRDWLPQFLSYCGYQGLPTTVWLSIFFEKSVFMSTHTGLEQLEGK